MKERNDIVLAYSWVEIQDGHCTRVCRARVRQDRIQSRVKQWRQTICSPSTTIISIKMTKKSVISLVLQINYPKISNDGFIKCNVVMQRCQPCKVHFLGYLLVRSTAVSAHCASAAGMGRLTVVVTVFVLAPLLVTSGIDTCSNYVKISL